MARDYRDLLDASQELLAFDGYLGAAGKAEKSQIQERFDGARRVFVYGLFRERTDKRAIWPSVAADLDRLERVEYAHAGEAFAYVREQLKLNIDRQMEWHPLVRFAIRWGPPAGIAAGGLIYLYMKWRSL